MRLLGSVRLLTDTGKLPFYGWLPLKGWFKPYLISRPEGMDPDLYWRSCQSLSFSQEHTTGSVFFTLRGYLRNA